jgi:methylmalonyl-CoA mutase N-terminal domain/subunit
MKAVELIKKWKEGTLAKAVARFPERKKQFKTGGDLPAEHVYLPNEVDENYEKKLGMPGEYPYTRGIQPTMYRGRFWTMRQYAGFSTAKESNERYKYLLSQGTKGLSVAFDLPTQIGYDSDDKMSAGEVGKVGVAIDTLADMEILFDQIPLNKISTSMTINAPAAVLLCMYVAVAQKQGAKPEEIRGTIQNDILKEYIARGTYIYPPKESLRIITNIFEWCAENTPSFNTISISGYHIREAGSTAVEEVALTLANACTYVDKALEAGLDIDVFAKRLAFFFNASNDLLEELAKFRAARRMWAKIMKERYKAKDPKSWMLRFHTQTAGNTLTAQQIDNNIVRVTIQALASVLGGTQSLHTNSRDEALSLPTEDSVRIALRTQQIIAHESGVANVIDPLGGSYYIEHLTDQIEEKATKIMQEIDDAGGVVEAINDGFVQRIIEDSAYRYQMDIEKKERIIVGVNDFIVEESKKPEIMRLDPEVERNQISALKKVKAQRDNAKVQETLASLRKAAQGDDNLMPHILEAVKAYASLGEICNVLRDEFGEFVSKSI